MFTNFDLIIIRLMPNFSIKLFLCLIFAILFINRSIMSQDFLSNQIEKEGYKLDFQDEFNTKELDSAKWLPYYLPQWSSRARSASNYNLTSQSLILKIDKWQKPWCPEFNGEIKVSSIQTGVFSGELNTSEGQHKFSPECRVRQVQMEQRLYTARYGYFEIRAKALKSNQNVCAFWMIGFEDEPRKSAEICIMEIKGHNVKGGRSVNGYGLRAFQDRSLKDEFFEDVFDYDASNFHIYAMEWKPNGIDFYIDNLKVRSINQSPDYEMQLMLNIYEIPNLERNANDDEFPKQFEIDYVRVYRPLRGY